MLCPNCKSKKIKTVNQGGSQTTYYICSDCNFKGTKEKWENCQQDKTKKIKKANYNWTGEEKLLIESAREGDFGGIRAAIEAGASALDVAIVEALKSNIDFQIILYLQEESIYQGRFRVNRKDVMDMAYAAGRYDVVKIINNDFGITIPEYMKIDNQKISKSFNFKKQASYYDFLRPQSNLRRSVKEGDIGGIRAALADGAEINKEIIAKIKNPMILSYLIDSGAEITFDVLHHYFLFLDGNESVIDGNESVIECIQLLLENCKDEINFYRLSVSLISFDKTKTLNFQKKVIDLFVKFGMNITPNILFLPIFNKNLELFLYLNNLDSIIDPDTFINLFLYIDGHLNADERAISSVINRKDFVMPDDFLIPNNVLEIIQRLKNNSTASIKNFLGIKTSQEGSVAENKNKLSDKPNKEYDPENIDIQKRFFKQKQKGNNAVKDIQDWRYDKEKLRVSKIFNFKKQAAPKVIYEGWEADEEIDDITDQNRIEESNETAPDFHRREIEEKTRVANQNLSDSLEEGDIGGIRAALSDGADAISESIYSAILSENIHIHAISYLLDIDSGLDFNDDDGEWITSTEFLEEAVDSNNYELVDLILTKCRKEFSTDHEYFRDRYISIINSTKNKEIKNLIKEKLNLKSFFDSFKEKFQNLFRKKSGVNIMKKTAREFLLTDQQKERKSDTNRAFPEGIQSDKNYFNNGGTKDFLGLTDTRRFDTVDRKEPRFAPDPRDLIPGYKEWHDREVDKYYDGWLDDHIENSGGKVVGSNTEKTMNLNEGERNHLPVYPTEANTERRLETRHHFDDDYIRIIANNNSHLVLAKIKKLKNEWQVTDSSGKKNLGKYKTKKEAIDRLKQVEYFKQANQKDQILTSSAYKDLYAQKAQKIVKISYQDFNNGKHNIPDNLIENAENFFKKQCNQNSCLFAFALNEKNKEPKKKLRPKLAFQSLPTKNTKKMGSK